MNPKGDEEGRLGLLLNNALLQKQLSQLREEARANRCWMRNVMRGSREKDKEIMQLIATMSHGERTFNYVEGTLDISGGDAVVAKPSLLSGSSMQSDPPYSGVGCNSPICKNNQAAVLIGSDKKNDDHHRARRGFADINRPLMTWGTGYSNLRQGRTPLPGRTTECVQAPSLFSPTLGLLLSGDGPS